MGWPAGDMIGRMVTSRAVTSEAFGDRWHLRQRPGRARADVGRDGRAVQEACGGTRRGPCRLGDDRQRRSCERAGRSRGCDARRRASARMWCSLQAARRSGWPKARGLRKPPAPTSSTSTWVVPARHVTNGEAGSALMRDLDHALRLIDATVGAVSVPVTLKMRLGWDHNSINAPELAQRARSGGRKTDHRSRPHALPVLQGAGGLGGGSRRQGCDHDPAGRQRRHPVVRGCARGAGAIRRRRGDDRPRRAGPALAARADRPPPRAWHDRDRHRRCSASLAFLLALYEGVLAALRRSRRLAPRAKASRLGAQRCCRCCRRVARKC